MEPALLKILNDSEKPLIMACELGNLKISELLIKKGCQLEQSNHKGQTALMMAVKSSNLQLVQYLIIQGCDINKQDLKGNSVLHYAFSYGYYQIADTLLKVKIINLELKNENGKYAYEMCAESQFRQIYAT